MRLLKRKGDGKGNKDRGEEKEREEEGRGEEEGKRQKGREDDRREEGNREMAEWLKKHPFLSQRNGFGILAHIWGSSHPPVTPNPKEPDSFWAWWAPPPTHTHINVYIQMHTEVGESGERGRE